MLLRASAIDAKNELEEFLFIWTALEFLIKDIYSHHHKASFGALSNASGIGRVGLLSALLSPRPFDKGKDGLSFKLLASVYVLDKAQVVQLFDRFDPLRRFRNEAFHEASISNLKAKTIHTRQFLLDVLRLHRGL